MPPRFAGDGELNDDTIVIEAEDLPPEAIIEAPAPTPLTPCLEFRISPAALSRLLRHPPLAAMRAGRPRTADMQTVWHDTADGALHAQGLALAEQAGRWRLERLVPNGSAGWLPAAPAPVLAEADNPDLLAPGLPGKLVPVAAFAGRRRSYSITYAGADGRIDVLEGALRGVAQDEPACRVQFAGPGSTMAGLALDLAAAFPLEVPEAGLAADALRLARGIQPAPRNLGAPDIPPGLSAEEALVLIVSHLTDVILHWAPLAAAGHSETPVHQMRVAVRRLRSAIGAFRRALGEDAAALNGGLKTVASTLGAARDWDVFLGSTIPPVLKAFPGDRRLTALLATARRKRQAAYQALREYLASEAWHLFSIRLALLPTARPWIEAETGDLAVSAAAFAGHALQRRFKHVLRAGSGFSDLAPEALHELRKQCKQLRYVSEFFEPLFPHKPARRFLRRLERLQEVLGAVNDSNVAAHLMEQLGPGRDRAFAAGLVQGYGAALAAPVSAEAGDVWEKFLSADPFWAG